MTLSRNAGSHATQPQIGISAAAGIARGLSGEASLLLYVGETFIILIRRLNDENVQLTVNSTNLNWIIIRNGL